MFDSYIDFPELIDEAMRDVVRKALLIVEQEGLPGEHHFYISFRTDLPGVEISEALKTRHPNEITIVLQHQFWDLKVGEDAFTVTLSFNNVPEKLNIPFYALTAFADPSVKFGLQFHTNIDDDLMEELMEHEEDLLEALEEQAKKDPAKEKDGNTPAEDKPMGEVVTLDAFRKNKKPKDTQ